MKRFPQSHVNALEAHNDEKTALTLGLVVLSAFCHLVGKVDDNHNLQE